MIKAEPVSYSSIVGGSIMLRDESHKYVGMLSLLNVENKEQNDKIINFVTNIINENSKEITL